jgi:alkylmercury lyase-like protein
LSSNGSGKKSATVGLSPTPTLYKLHWNGGKEEFVHCGADILLNGLEGDLEGEAHCPICGTRTKLVIANGKIDGLDPKDAMIHVVEMPTNSGSIWIECETTHIFDKRDCLQKWTSRYTGKKGLVASVEAYHDRLIARRKNRLKAPEYLPKLSS